MIDSDITGNITSDCQELMQTEEIPETHHTDCTCDCCCPISISNCQDNRDECEETEQPSGRMKKMKDKLVPIVANCAVIIAVIGLSGSISRISAVERISATRISAIQRQIIPAIQDINRVDIFDRSVINDSRTRTNAIEISSNRIAT